MTGKKPNPLRLPHAAMPPKPPRRGQGVFLSWLLTLPLLGGCTLVGPNFTQPTAQLDTSWAAGPAIPATRCVPTAAAPCPPTDTAWWRSLNDPQLTRLVETAAAQNLTLQRAGVRVLQARAVLAATVGSYYPQQQQAYGMLLTERSASNNSGAFSSGNRGYNLGRAGITAAWEIDFWGRFRRAIEASDSDLVASIADYDNAMVSLLSDTAAAYVNLRGLERRLAITRSNIGLQRQSLRIATSRFREGATSERDVDQAQSQLSGTEAQVPSLEAQIDRARNALAVLLGVTPGEMRGMIQPGPIPRPALMVATGVPADLLRRRPDLRASIANAASQSARVGVSRAELFPAVSLSGSFGFLSTDAGSMRISSSGAWRSSQSFSAGPSVVWNILNWGQITNQVRAQDAVLQGALLGYQQSVLQAQREVEDGLSSFAGAQRGAVSLRRAVTASRRAANVSLTQYEQGQTDYTTVLLSQRLLLGYEEQLAVAEADIPQGLISVYRALGGGWEIREGRPLVTEATRTQMGLRTDWGPLLDYDDGRLTPPRTQGLLPQPTF